MGRILSIDDETSLDDLRSCCLKEFVDSGDSCKEIIISYWPPNKHELATGMKTPPVILTNDVGLKYFLRHYRLAPAMNLFVTLVTGCKLTSPSASEAATSRKGKEKEVDTFVTPVQKNRVSGSSPMFSDVDINVTKRNISTSSVSSDIGLGVFDLGISPIKCMGSVGSSNLPSLDDECMIAEAAKIESNYFGARSGLFFSDDLQEGTFTDISSEEDGERTCPDVVLSKGYDHEFWGPLLEDPYGGSNVDELLSDLEAIDVKNATTTAERSSYICQTNDVFSHEVVVGGGSNSSGFFAEEKSNFNFGARSGSMSEPSMRSQRFEGVRLDVGVTDNRKLEEIDDSEFDLPPLYDDTQFVIDEILDLDFDDDDELIYDGKVFGCKEDCRIALVIYAIKNVFHFKRVITKRHYFVVACSDETCHWRVNAHELKGSGYYEIRKPHLEHTCSIDTRSGFKRKASARVLAAVYKSKYGNGMGGPKPMDLQQLILEELRVSSSYMQCYRAQEIARANIRGSGDESYNNLPTFFHMLKLANPGSVTDYKTEKDDEGGTHFLYCFMAFGASIVGFRELRRVMVVDGTRLSGKCKGVLLTASGQDANCQVYPLAFAIVDSENELAWTWFFQKLSLIIADSPCLTFISDRAQSIVNAKKTVYPLSHHGACIVHLARNVISQFKNKGLARLVVAAGMVYEMKDFNAIFGKIQATNAACGRYFEKIGLAKWTRVYFLGNRYNLMTSNIAEQLNKALMTARNCPIVEVLTFIQTMMTRWFCARRKKSQKHHGHCTPEIDKQMTLIFKKARCSRINPITTWRFDVHEQFSGKYTVDLAAMTCSCKVYDKFKIPCGHSMLAGGSVGLPFASLGGPWTLTKAWSFSYLGVINPNGDPRNEDLPAHLTAVKIQPPWFGKRGVGRNQEKRFPSKGEVSAPRQPKSVPNRCAICKEVGHNRKGCKKPK